jgi:hypothetical protein
MRQIIKLEAGEKHVREVWAMERQFPITSAGIACYFCQLASGPRLREDTPLYYQTNKINVEYERSIRVSYKALVRQARGVQ